MKKYVFIVTCITILVHSKEVSFVEFKESALKHSHRLNLRHIDTSIEQSRLDSIYSTLYPQLSMGYSGEYNKNLDPSASGSVSIGDTTINSSVPYEHSVSLRLNYELYHFGTTMKQIDIGEKEVAIKRLEQCSEEVKLYQELLEHYSRAQRAQSEKYFKSQMRTLRQELYTLKQRLYGAGKESRVSVGDEAIRLIDLERDIVHASMELEENLMALSQKSHLELDRATTHLLPLSIDENITADFSFSNTPQGRSYEEKMAQKQSEISMLNRSQLPIISLYSSYYLYGSDHDNFSRGFKDISSNSWNAGVSLRWSLFEGFKYNSESTRLYLELDRIREEIELSKREYEHTTQIAQQKILRLDQLQKNEMLIVNETRSKIVMLQRLREQGESDAVSVVSVKLEELERELTLESEMIQQRYEAESLKLQHARVDTCTAR